MHQLNDFYLQQEEPLKGTLLALKEIIQQQDEHITHVWKYGMPFFCYKGKMFCYLWIQKKSNKPYIGFVEGHRFNENYLIQEKRSRMKIMLLDPEEDLPLQKIVFVLHKALDLYRSGIVKIKAK